MVSVRDRARTTTRAKYRARVGVSDIGKFRCKARFRVRVKFRFMVTVSISVIFRTGVVVVGRVGLGLLLGPSF
jgi:hypothetical protein